MSEKQTRRRGSVLEQAIRDAAWAELSERGWSGFTIDAVAARSGTAKSVIYRRWENRVQLAQDMLVRAIAASEADFRSSGLLRSDLVAFLSGMTAFLRTPFGDAARGVVFEGDARPTWFGPTAVVSEVAVMVDHAVARGELDGRPSAFALNLGPAVVMSEFLHTGAPPSSTAVTELVDTAWLPVLRGGGRPAS